MYADGTFELKGIMRKMMKVCLKKPNEKRRIGEHVRNIEQSFEECSSLTKISLK